jgi:hypothetical protein
MPKSTRPIHARWPWRLHGSRPGRWVRKGKCFYVIECRKRWFRLTWQTYYGYYLSGLFAKGAHPLLGHQPVTVMERPAMGIKKRESKAKDIKHLAALETTLFHDRLSLVEHCSLLQYEDGSSRVPGWITIKTQGAAWVVQVKDPDSCSSFSAVAETLDKAVDTAALLLACDDAPWEADKWLAEVAKRNSKK